LKQQYFFSGFFFFAVGIDPEIFLFMEGLLGVRAFFFAARRNVRVHRGRT
jgi:hypothetical protein